MILTTAELFTRTGIPEPALQKWSQRGTVQAVKKGRTLLFDLRDFQKDTVRRDISFARPAL